MKIGIAVVVDRHEVLVGKRPLAAHLGGMLEFPGGKCDVGETPAACAIRECQEETGLRVRIDATLHHQLAAYDDCERDLYFYKCSLLDTEDRHAARTPFEWCSIDSIEPQHFPSGNLMAIARLKETSSRGPTSGST